MRCIPAILFSAVLAVLSAVPIRAEDPAQLWRICAVSEAIVEGTLTVPLDHAGRIKTGGNGYALVFVKVEGTLKGPRRSSLLVRYFANRNNRGIPDQVLTGLDGRKAVLFLIPASGGGGEREWFFAGFRDSLRPASADLARSIAAEAGRQAAVLRHWKPAARSMTREVKVLIGQMLERETAKDAYRRLEGLGQPAVPAIIDQMDDRRELPLKQISLRDFSPDAFEGLRHYGPDEVVDVLAAILNQIKHEHFGFIYNGAADDERVRTVAGWRIYEDVLLDHPEWLKDR